MQARPMKVARIYMRVSTKEQDIRRQEAITESARQAGYYIAGVYRDTESGVRYDRPELLRMIEDLQPGDVVIAEQMDRLSRGPLAEAEQLVATIRSKGARLAVPGVVDLSDLSDSTTGVAKVILEQMQELLLKVTLQRGRSCRFVSCAPTAPGSAQQRTAALPQWRQLTPGRRICVHHLCYRLHIGFLWVRLSSEFRH